MIREPRPGEDFQSYAKELRAATKGDPDARKVAEAVIVAMDDARQNLPRPRLECGADLYRKAHETGRLEMHGLPVTFSAQLSANGMRYVPTALVMPFEG